MFEYVMMWIMIAVFVKSCMLIIKAGGGPS
jgi:hypothetical protein